MLADATAASNTMRAFITPAVATLCALAGLASAGFLVHGGFQYMTSSGKPEKLDYAKKIIRNAVLGLILVFAAAALTAILVHAYSASGGNGHDKLPTITPNLPAKNSSNLTDVLVNAIIGLLRDIVQSIAQPFIQALNYFTNSTPMMGDNSSVFNLWLAVVGITDVLFIGVVALLGFQVMSFESLGIDEVDIKQLVPQLVVVFLLINVSIFAVDAIISLSNVMISALKSGFPGASIWDDLVTITSQSGEMGLAGLLVMLAFLVLSVMLLVYYVGRLIALYLGAILAPLVLMLWLLPAFKDFAISAFKVYLTTIFVLFVHVAILLLAGSIFLGILGGDKSAQPNAFMALILGIATVTALLKTQGVMRELSYAASAPRAARELSTQFIRSASTVYATSRFTSNVFTKSYSGLKKRFGSSDNSDGGSSRPSGPSSGFGSTSSDKPGRTGEVRKAEKLEAV
jgi:hypothetical protein